MLRRDLFRLLSAAAVAPLLPPDVFLLAQQAHPKTGYKLRTFTPHQNNTVVTMSELILPATDTPGAEAARVNEFMDVILTDWATHEERQRFLKGLNDVDVKSNAQFGKPFIKCTVSQQTSLLQALDEEVDWNHLPPHDEKGYLPDYPCLQLRGEFFRSFKLMTIHGYYTSEIGQTQDLKREIIPGAFHGCTSPEPRKQV